MNEQNLRQDIQSAINAFSTQPIFDAGINLFTTLGYDTSLQSPLDKKDFDEFSELYINSSPNKERFSDVRALSSEWKSIDILFQLTDESFGNQKNFNSSLVPTNPQSYLCFAIELSKNEYTKTSLAAITREVNKIFTIPIIIIFKYGNKITLSVIGRRLNKKDSERDVLEKVTLIKDIRIENPHRAHIDILCQMSLEALSKNHTINDFKSLHEAWEEILDTRLLTKQFYEDLFKWYEWACQNVTFPKGNTERNSKGEYNVVQTKENNNLNLIRLITRIMFVWFIKQKNLVPEWIFDEKELKNIISEFDAESETNGNYYNAVLQNLFFATLNNEIDKRAFADDESQKKNKQFGMKTFFRDDKAKSFFRISHEELIEKFKSVPFLNGGLFECLDKLDDDESNTKNIEEFIDGFSRESAWRAFVPNNLFFQKQIPDHATLASVASLRRVRNDEQEHEGLINILSRYNFTVEENTPNDVQVALDPELLGKVFENLLGTYNPETSETARKDSGSFYTPREIVNFMVNESLISYLSNQITDNRTQFVIARSEATKQSLDKKLRSLVESDEQVSFSEEERRKILESIDKCKILDPACGSGAFPMGALQKMVQIIHKLDGQNDIWKQLQIQKISSDKNLSAKDKNELTAQIVSVFDENDLDYARKLYLIENCIYGVDVQPIAVQIAKLRFFISLIVDQKVDSSKPNYGIRPLPNLENHIVIANSLISAKKTSGFLTSNETLNLEEELKQIRHKSFSAKTPAVKASLRKKDKETRKKLEESLIQDGMGAQAAHLLATYDPYNKNEGATFFDAEWMFGVSDGFDIVIGNPPYIQLQKNGGELASLYEDEKYRSFAKTGDIYCLFYERGFNLLKNGGHLCFITSNKWMRAGYGEKLREFLSKNTNPLLLVDFAGVKIFESATVDTNILLFEKGANPKKTKACVTKNLSQSDLNNLSAYIQKNSGEIAFNTSESWVVLSPVEQSIKRKIEKAGTPLKDWDIQINYGIKTGFNDAFIIDTKTRDEILSNCKTADEKKRTEELIRPILRGRDIKCYGYEWAGLWLVNTHNGVKENGKVKIPRIDIKDYPAVKKHLDKYWDKIKNRADKGDTPYNLRNCAYLEDFARPKIVWASVGETYYSLVEGGKILLDTNYFFAMNKPEYLIGVLNSKLITFWINSEDTQIGNGGAYRHYKYNLERLPIPKVSQQKAKIESLVNEELKNPSAETEQEIDKLVYSLYGLSSAEIAFIEAN